PPPPPSDRHPVGWASSPSSEFPPFRAPESFPPPVARPARPRRLRRTRGVWQGEGRHQWESVVQGHPPEGGERDVRQRGGRAEFHRGNQRGRHVHGEGRGGRQV